MIVYFPHFLSLRSRYFGGKNKLKEVLSLALCPMQIVGILLNDHSPGVLGAAAASFASICPNNFSLIGRNYQRLCEILPDVEEWGQIVLIGILLRFVIARHGLVKESLMFSLHCTEFQFSK